MKIHYGAGLPDEAYDIAKDAEGRAFIPETYITRVSDDHPAHPIVKERMESDYANAIAFEVVTARFDRLMGLLKSWANAQAIDAEFVIFRQEPAAHFWLLFIDHAQAAIFEDTWIVRFGGDRGSPYNSLVTTILQETKLLLEVAQNSHILTEDRSKVREVGERLTACSGRS